jgi:hypothetical protein
MAPGMEARNFIRPNTMMEHRTRPTTRAEAVVEARARLNLRDVG